MDLQIRVRKQVLTCRQTAIAGSVNFVKAKFMFDDEWIGTEIHVIFSNGETPEKEIILGDTLECVVPWEVLETEGDLYISAVGLLDGDIRISTKLMDNPITVYPHGSLGGSDPSFPTPTFWDDLKNALPVDWSENDKSKLTHIRNRTHWKEEVEVDYTVLPNVEANPTTGFIWYGKKLGLEIGKEYTLEVHSIDGAIETIQTIATEFPIEIIGIEGIPCITLDFFTVVDGVVWDFTTQTVTVGENCYYFYDNSVESDLEKIIIQNLPSIETVFHQIPEEFLPKSFIDKIKAFKTYVDKKIADVDIPCDTEMSNESTNPVQNKIIKAYVDKEAIKINDITKFLQLGNINNTGIELGSLKTTTGEESASTTITRCDDYIPVIGGNTIYAIFENTTIKYISCVFYDVNKTRLSFANLYGRNMTTSTSLVTELEVPENAAYMRFSQANASVDYKVGIYYSYYNATTVEPYVSPSLYVNAEKLAKNGQMIDFDKFVTSNVITADAQAKVENHIIPEYEYNLAKVDALQKQISYLQDYISKLHTPTILDSGVCGENLTWELYSDGLLKISGTGRSYDYCKGLMIGKTREEIETYVATGGDPHYGFQEGKVYDDANAQYVSPWYKYRDEVSFTEYGGNYCTKASYDSHNPNGWKYNRIEIDEGITYLGDWLFYRVSGATELIIPNTVTELGDWAIRYSPTLKCIYLPDGITKVGYRGCSRNEVATAIRIGSGLATVGDYAFSQNQMVKYLEVQGDSNTTFGEYMCNGNRTLEYVSLKDVAEVGKYACVLCENLSKVDLPDTLTVIRESAFINNIGLTSIKIPPLVTTIEKNAFYGCENLKSVYIDSPTIAGGLKNADVYGRLVTYAKYIYVKSDITSVGAYLTNNFTKTIEIDGYVLYIKNE